MKTFKAHTSFIPITVVNSFSRETPAVVLPKTEYEITDSNAAGIIVNIKTPTVANSKKVIVQNIFISQAEIEKYGEVLTLTLSSWKLREILNQISFIKSCIDFDWGWEIKEIGGQYWTDNDPFAKGPIQGFLINTTFKRPDINTGVVGVGRGREMWISANASRESVVMTAWVCVELIVKHETMEAFTFGGAKILNPHKSLDELAYPEKITLSTEPQTH